MSKASKANRPQQAAKPYRRGIPAAVSSSEDESDEEQVDARGERKPLTEAELYKREGLTIQRDLDLTLKVEDEQPAQVQARVQEVKLEQEEGASELETDSDASESSEEESSAEEEQAKPLYKPVFVSKRNRDPKVVKALTQDEEELAEIERQAELERQREQAHQAVGDTIKRQIAEKQVQEVFPDVDDTDGLDPTAEFEAWKLRELQRIKRDADALYARERERDEIEARRALPEEVRLAEDLKHAQQTRDEKPKGNQAFMQKYHHKGVFYTGEDILQRDYTGQIEDQVVDVQSLPSIMQVRDFGKRSRTKHTHLKDVDTTKNDAGWGNQALGRRFAENGFERGGGARASGAKGGRACFNCGQEGHISRECPARQQQSRERDGGYGNRASNPAASTKDWGSHNDVRERRRSRTPEGRRRSRSRSRERYDKRRRVD